MDITTATPVEIDTELARLYGEERAAKARRDAAWESIRSAVRGYLGKGFREQATQAEVRDVLVEIAEIPEAERDYRQASIARSFDAAEKAQSDADNALLDQQPYDEEYDRRGRWTRAFLVNNSNGHVHRSRHCSTTYPTTQWLWLPEFSGHDEAEIVEKAGERACTVCYPSAPVEVLSRPTQIFTPDEIEKAKAREEREAAKAAREAAQITLSVWTENRRTKDVARQDVTWKTTRALQNDAGALVREITGAYALINGFDLSLLEWSGDVRVPVNRDEAFENLRLMLAALQERGVDTEALVAKNHKRAVNEGGRQWDGVL